MDHLTPEQSNLLQRIANSPLKYSELSDDDKEICKFLEKLKYINSTKITKSRSAAGFASFSIEFDELSISEAGKMYLINECLTDEQFQFLRKQMQSIRDLADTAITESKQSEKDAKFSKIVAIISIIISIVAIVIPIFF